MEIGAKASPLRLAERRTLIIRKSKNNHRLYAAVRGHSAVSCAPTAQSDARVYECPCPECGGFTEIKWSHIEWEPDGSPRRRRFAARIARR